MEAPVKTLPGDPVFDNLIELNLGNVVWRVLDVVIDWVVTKSWGSFFEKAKEDVAFKYLFNSSLSFFLFNFIFYLSLPEDIQILSLFRKPSDLLMLKL